MPTGTITRVFERRGFGYITPDQGDRDVYMHVALVEAQQTWLEEGLRVRFEAEDRDQGLYATSVHPLD
ncbi:MAG: cold shock domain-containing protein [Phycisphaerales bacterium]|nr:cold shock domain-containing protein [Phycisphaerales bacterium]